jgi:carbonic anhydrase
VPAEAITGLQPGSMFVHRNVANLVNMFDMNATSVLVYAVDYLQVKHIIVCGHYGCGGVRAAISPDNTGPLTLWLESVRDLYYQHQEELDLIETSSKRFDRLAELNVLQQCRNVIEIIDSGVSSQRQRSCVVHGWIFSLDNGLLRDLHFLG